MLIAVIGARGFPHVQGGVENHCEKLYPRLVKLGCEVIVFTRKPYVPKELKEFKGVKLIALPTIKNKFIETVLHTFIGIFAAKKYNPDILHIQAIGTALFTPLARFLGMKVVVTTHGANYKHLKWGIIAKVIFKIGEFLGVTFANRIIAVSETIADEIKRQYRKDPIVIYNGVEMPAILKTENALIKYGIEKGKYILSVGRFVPEKGFYDLIEAFEILAPKCWKLVIVGREDYKSSYSNAIREKAHLNKSIVLTGFLSGDPLRELYSHAGLFVLASYYEGLPIALLEAMSYGLLCIASNISGNRSAGLADDRYYKAGDVKALSEKIGESIIKALTLEERTAQIISITKKYNWDNISKEILDVYYAIKNIKQKQ